jgi:hypothetical protein
MPSKDASGNTTWSTTELLMAAALAVAAGATAGFLLGEEKEFDEDRPPIIVSNGSADFEAKSSHANYGKATWEPDSTNPTTVFRHVQPSGAPVGTFSLKTDPDNPNRIESCTYNGSSTILRPPFSGTSVTINYNTDANGSTLYSASLSIVGGQTVLTLTEPGELESVQKRKVKVKDIDADPKNKKKIRSFSISGFSCVLRNQGSTKVEVSQKR